MRPGAGFPVAPLLAQMLSLWHVDCTKQHPSCCGEMSRRMRWDMRRSIASIVLLGSLSFGCGPRAKPVTLDVSATRAVSVAPVQLEPGAGKVTAIEAWGGGRHGYKERDLAVLQQMLEETNPMPGPPESSLRLHVVVRRFLVAFHQSEAVGLACFAWAVTNPQAELVFAETVYASAYTSRKGVNGVKDPIHQGITKRVHSATQAVAAGLQLGPLPSKLYEDFESAAASVPDALGPILVVTLQRGGVERGVEYAGETGEEFARCDDTVDWYERLGIPRPPEEAAPGEASPPVITEPPPESPPP